MQTSQGPRILSREEAELRLRNAGIQPTSQRIVIAQYALVQKDHATVEQVKAWADRHLPKLSLATVYNTINTLVEADLLQPIHVPTNDRARFDSNTASHTHFLDEDSGELTDLPEASVQLNGELDHLDITAVDVLVRGKRC